MMREINNVKYFDIAEICEMFHNKIKQEEIRDYFEKGKINGKKIENKWYADENAINEFAHEVLLKVRAYTVGPYKIDLSDIKLEGRILDIGGGGQGVIGQFKGEQVVAIDPNKGELEEAPSINDLKIIMDAKDLKFLDNTFDTTTAFYTFMYIPAEDHEVIFKEIHRVLTRNGEFVLWDAIIPNRGDDKRDIFFIELKIKISDKIIDAGYGVSWDKEQGVNYFFSLSKSIGFELLESKEEKDAFYLRFRKI